MLALYLEELPYREEGGTTTYDPEPLMEAAAGAFALGCAMAVEAPDRVPLILEQTHPGEVDAIVADCTEPLQERVVEAQAAKAELVPELFLGALFDTFEDGEPVEATVAYNVISIGFEYGCILAQVERRAAQMVRNSYNRHQVLDATSPEDETSSGAVPLPFKAIQELAKEVLSAYEQDIGFGRATP